MSLAIERWRRHTKSCLWFTQIQSTLNQRNTRRSLLECFEWWVEVLHWRQCREQTTMQLNAKQELITTLRHLACAQLLESTLQSFHYVRTRQLTAFRAFSEYSRTKKLWRRLQRGMLASTRVRRKARILQKAWKVWYQDILHCRLLAFGQHIAKFSSLTNEVEEQRTTQEQEMEEIITTLRLKFTDWEAEILETKTLLHASCDTFLPDRAFNDDNVKFASEASPSQSDWIVKPNVVPREQSQDSARRQREYVEEQIRHEEALKWLQARVQQARTESGAQTSSVQQTCLVENSSTSALEMSSNQPQVFPVFEDHYDGLTPALSYSSASSANTNPQDHMTG